MHKYLHINLGSWFKITKALPLHIAQVKRVFYWSQNKEPQNEQNCFVHCDYHCNMKSYSWTLFNIWFPSALFQSNQNQDYLFYLPTRILALALKGVIDWFFTQSHQYKCILKSSREEYCSSQKFYLAVPVQPHSNKYSRPDGLILPSFK